MAWITIEDATFLDFLKRAHEGEEPAFLLLEVMHGSDVEDFTEKETP